MSEPTSRSTPEAPDEIEYQGQVPSQSDVEAAAAEIWRKAWVADSSLRALVPPCGPDNETPPLPLKFDVTQGANPLSVTLIVMAAPAVISVSKTVALDIWHKIILPKLERIWGEGAVREVKRHH